MKIILKADVEDLGKIGDVLDVADGYGRNYLLPQRFAVKATSGNLKQLEASIQAREEQKRDELEVAKALALKVEEVTVVIKAKSGEKGRLFGSVTNADLAAQLLEQHGIEVDKRKVLLKDPIKAVGFYQVSLRLNPEVVAELKVNVEAEDDPKKQAAAEDQAPEAKEVQAEQVAEAVEPEVAEVEVAETEAEAVDAEAVEPEVEPEAEKLTEETETLIEEAENAVIED